MSNNLYPAGDYPVTENLGLALEGMPDLIAQNFIDLDELFPGGAAPPATVNNKYNIEHGLSGAIMTVRVPYSITATDILRGYAYVPVEYPYSWPDLNETNTFAVCNPDQTDGTDFAPGCIYNRMEGGCMAILNLTAAVVLVQGQIDYTDLTAGQGYSFSPLAEGIYAITIVATSIAPVGTYPAGVDPQVNFDLSYTDHAGAEYNDAVVSILDNLNAESIINPVYALPSAPITIYSSYVTFGVAGTVPTSSYVIGTHVGTIAYGATITQATSGATASFYGIFSVAGNPNTMVYKLLTGTDLSRFGYAWSDGLGNSFTPPNNATVQPGSFTGPGTGVVMTQAVTGAYGLEMNAPTTEMYLGPHVQGVADSPSGYVDIPGTPPSPTVAYAWVDSGNGGVFLPTAAWSDSTTRVVFPYNAYYRIVQMPNNSTVYTPGQTTYLNFISIHD